MSPQMPNAFDGRRLVLGGVATRELRLADSRTTGPRVLFLHGWSDSADTFKPLMRALAHLDTQLVALDLPHFGLADDLAEGPMLPQFVRFVDAALDHYAASAVSLLPVGQSLGARALLMALAQTPRPGLRHAVAIAPAPMDLPPWQKMLVRNASLASSVSNIADAHTLDGLVAGLVTSYRRTCFVAPERIETQVFEDYGRHYSAARVRRHIESLRRIGGELESPIDLHRVRTKIHLIWGARDRMAPATGAQAYLHGLPDAQLSTFEDCGHHAHLERADEVAALIESILSNA